MRQNCVFLQTILSLLTVLAASAQPMAVLQGHVVDSSGAALPNASIVVRDAATGLTRMAPTDAEGAAKLSF
jgi:Carboxypeptidase regulatory-like domain